MNQSVNENYINRIDKPILENCKLNLKKNNNKKLEDKNFRENQIEKNFSSEHENVSIMEVVKRKFSGIKEFLTFAFVGAVNTSLEILTLNFLWWATGLYKGNINYLFKFIALILCSIVGYSMNKKLTFKSKQEDKKTYIKYVVIFAFLSFIEAVMIAEMTKIPVRIIPIYIWANGVSFFASAVTGLANFVISKFIIFKDKN